MQGCFYWRKCEDCRKLFELENECKIKGLLTFNKVVMNWEVAFRGQNKHFKIMQRNWFWIFYILVNPVNETANGQMLEKANMLFLTKETPDKHRSLKTQLLLATNLQKTEKISVWKKFGYFSDERANFNIGKKNFPENALCYVNQCYLSTVKTGELAMYNHNFIIGQLVVAANQPKDINEDKCKADEFKFITFIYDKSTGQFNTTVSIYSLVRRQRNCCSAME